MLKKLLTWSGVAFLVFFVAYRPDTAAQIVQELGSGVVAIGQGFMDFVGNLL